MQIGIIGAGHVGETLARAFVQAGHEVGLSNAHGPESLRDLVADIGSAACSMSVEEAEQYGEIVVLAIPFGQYRNVPGEGLRHKVVIDATNYYPERDGVIDELENGAMTSSELIRRQFRDVRLVKAFNTVRSGVLATEAQAERRQGRLAIPVAGDDEGAKRVVGELIGSIGFDMVDAGPLANGGRLLQPGSPVFIARLDALEMERRLLAA
jgi:hypothetical protein